MQTEMSVDLRLSEVEARPESPPLCTSPYPVPVTVWVGAEEHPAFLDQASLHMGPGRHHFDVIKELSRPVSPLINALLTSP